jgi:hypothetical protein
MSSIKPLPTDLRDHLAELTGNELKVWMSYYLRTGNYDLISHPGNGTIERDTGICNDTVKTCKASLRAKGWLTYTGDYKQPRRPGGMFAVPVMEVRLPWRPDWSAVVTDVSLAYDAMTVVEKTTHGTVVENFHPEGSSSCSNSGSSSLSSSCAATPSDSNKTESPKGVPQHNEKIEAKCKPANLEPKPTPGGFHGQKTNGQAKKVRYAPDGTPWPKYFNSWTNGERLEWLEAHGWEQGRMVEAPSQKTVETTAGDRKPTATPTPLLNPPSSAPPPNGYCPQCREPDDFCDCQRSISIENTEDNRRDLDNWEEL